MSDAFDYYYGYQPMFEMYRGQMQASKKPTVTDIALEAIASIKQSQQVPMYLCQSYYDDGKLVNCKCGGCR